eukprot:2411792-Rhodomonas_salina.1
MGRGFQGGAGKRERGWRGLVWSAMCLRCRHTLSGYAIVQVLPSYAICLCYAARRTVGTEGGCGGRRGGCL